MQMGLSVVCHIHVFVRNYFIPFFKPSRYVNVWSFIRGQVVVQLVEALCHKTGGPKYDSHCSPWKFSSDLILLSAFSSLGDHSASNRNEYQEISIGSKVRPECQAYNFSVSVVPNVKVSIPPRESP
jgi:hypothetical protein